MVLGVARIALQDEKKIRQFMTDVLSLPPLRGEEWNVISPRVLREVWRLLLEYTDTSDPLRELKNSQNRRALEMYPMAKELVLKSPDPFMSALKLAIAGNEMDVMTNITSDGTSAMLTKLDSFIIDTDNVEQFKRGLDRAHTITYFTDNCGEIVFDKLFIATLTSMKPYDITVVTRTIPILNDATLQDAQSVGLHEIAKLIDNGSPHAYAGTIVSEVSPEVQSLINGSDLLIAKGVGNYDALTEEASLKGRLTMLYYGKCYPCCSATDAEIGDLIVYNF
jgi:uncharacterized protein with ATP-grasp and redox domains